MALVNRLAISRVLASILLHFPLFLILSLGFPPFFITSSLLVAVIRVFRDELSPPAFYTTCKSPFTKLLPCSIALSLHLTRVAVFCVTRDEPSHYRYLTVPNYLFFTFSNFVIVRNRRIFTFLTLDLPASHRYVALVAVSRVI